MLVGNTKPPLAAKLMAPQTSPTPSVNFSVPAPAITRAAPTNLCLLLALAAAKAVVAAPLWSTETYVMVLPNDVAALAVSAAVRRTRSCLVMAMRDPSPVAAASVVNPSPDNSSSFQDGPAATDYSWPMAFIASMALVIATCADWAIDKAISALVFAWRAASALFSASDATAYTLDAASAQAAACTAASFAALIEGERGSATFVDAKAASFVWP